jgi:hypothetical protein
MQSSAIDDATSDGGGSGGSAVDHLGSVDDQLTDLRLMTSYLENELHIVRQESADLRRDLLTSALQRGHAPTGSSSSSSAALTADDVSRLVDKMTQLMNRTAPSPQQQLQGPGRLPSAELPRGAFFTLDVLLLRGYSSKFVGYSSTSSEICYFVAPDHF